jgi:hypothetical protein
MFLKPNKVTDKTQQELMTANWEDLTRTMIRKLKLIYM